MGSTIDFDSLLNLTSHDVNIKLSDEYEDKFLRIPPTGTVARCNTDFDDVDNITIEKVVDGFFQGIKLPIRERHFLQPYDLPEPKEGTYFIVSRIVAEACANVRDDLLIVDGTIKEGREIIGCEGLARWPKSNQGICDDGIECLQNKEVYLNNDGRCGACQEQRDYEDDKFPKEE